MSPWWAPTPTSTSSACRAAGLTPRNCDRTALASFPGITRGMTKLTVSAAHRVTRNSPPRRARYLIAGLARVQRGLWPGCSAGGVQVGQDHAVIGELVGRRLGVRIGLRRPATDVARVVLIPVDALGDRDERDLVHHHLLDLMNDLNL